MYKNLHIETQQLQNRTKKIQKREKNIKLQHVSCEQAYCNVLAVEVQLFNMCMTLYYPVFQTVSNCEVQN